MNKGSRKLLNQLIEAGADVIVGKPDNQKRMKGNFHRKYFVRLSDNTHADLVILPSENFTNRTIPVFNHASYHLNNHALGAQIITAHQEAALKGKPYAQFISEQKVAVTPPLEEPTTKQERKCCKGWYAVWQFFKYSKN